MIIIYKNKIQKKKYWNNKKIVIGKNKWKKILNLYVKELIEYEKKAIILEQIKKFFDYLRKNFNLNHRNNNENKKSILEGVDENKKNCIN